MSARVMGWIPEAGRLNVTLGTLARLGATTDNDIVIRVDGVSRTHARIVGGQDGYWVEDANSRNGTWLNGERVTRARLRHLDVITLGRFAELVFVERTTGETVMAPAPPAEMRVRIEWTEGPTRGQAIDIARGETLIGRADSCAIVVDSPAISRAHARLSNTGDRVVIEDLGSANGTSVDGQPIKAPVTLQSGAEVALGQARRFRVWIEGGAAVPTAAAPGAEATPASAQDMEWATRLVYNAADLEAVSRAAGGIDKPAAPVQQPVGKSPSPPVAPAVPAPAARGGAAASSGGASPAPQPKAPAPARPPAPAPARPAAPPAAAQAAPAPPRPAPAPGPASPATPAAPATQYGGPGLSPPPAFSGGSTPEAPRTQIGGPAFKPPKTFEPDAPPSPPEGSNLPGATVLGFREVGPPPRLGGGTTGGTGSGSTPGAAPPPAFEPTKEVASPWKRADPPAAIESVQLSGDLGVYSLPRGVSTVGRSPEATIRIDSREVSRIHAVVTVTEQEVIVEDRGSVNGTSINGAPVAGRKALAQGDRVSFADFEFRVDLKRTEGN
jgi:pSer/pThr/pTyr-binding forkhead associated (FHA) protein